MINNTTSLILELVNKMASISRAPILKPPLFIISTELLPTILKYLLCVPSSYAQVSPVLNQSEKDHFYKIVQFHLNQGSAGSWCSRAKF